MSVSVSVLCVCIYIADSFVLIVVLECSSSGESNQPQLCQSYSMRAYVRTYMQKKADKPEHATRMYVVYVCNYVCMCM